MVRYFHLENTETYSPWIMVAEECIKCLKQSSSRKTLKSESPNRLWDHCIELKAFIRSNNALDIYGLGGQVPETVMTGQIDDIINLCEYKWFQWMMYYQLK